MLKKKSAAKTICDNFGDGFRPIAEGQKRFRERPMPDEAICAILWEYKDRGKKGYDLTERLFPIVRENYPKPDRPVDFVLMEKGHILAVGLARYDSDRGGAQEDDRTGQYRDCAAEVLAYADNHGLNTKVVCLNDGPGLLLGSMWRDYAHIDEAWGNRVKVATLRMFPERVTMNWLKS